jgi:hypothetical protein
MMPFDTSGRPKTIHRLKQPSRQTDKLFDPMVSEMPVAQGIPATTRDRSSWEAHPLPDRLQRPSNAATSTPTLVSEGLDAGERMPLVS